MAMWRAPLTARVLISTRADDSGFYSPEAPPRPPWDFTREARLVRASLLYADDVRLVSEELALRLTHMHVLPLRPDLVFPDWRTRRQDQVLVQISPPPVHAALERLRSLLLPDADASSTAAPWLPWVWAEPGTPAEWADAARALDDLARILEARAVHFGPIQSDDALDYSTRSEIEEQRALWDEQNVRVFDDPAWKPRTRAELDATVAETLLGDFVAYPDADVDVILDVRERLVDSRARFRLALSEATREATEGLDGSQQVAALAADIRERVVRPALLEIEDELRQLNVVDTLLRSAKDRPAVAAAGAAIAVLLGGIQGPVDTEILAGTLGSSALLSSAAREVLLRREHGRSVKAKSFWYLHRLDRQLRDWR